MFEILFLGTAASIPSRERGLPALIVQQADRRFLIDCGEGTQRQIMASGAGFRGLDTILLTHGHLDHILGLGGLAASLALLRREEPMAIYAGQNALRLSHRLLSEIVWPGGGPFPITFHELHGGPFLEAPGLRVSAFPVRHRGPDSFGFLFEEPARRRMLEDRLAALEIPAGPARARLARGEPAILADGSRIEPDMVLGPPIPAARIAIVGDAESVADLVEAVRGVDILVIEGTFLDADADKARARSHLTIGQAAWLAKEAQVDLLCLTHLSNRYGTAEIEAAAQAAFPRVKVARDFDRVSTKTRDG